MKLTIEDIRGVWKAELNGRAEFGDTIEDILWALCPDAPAEYLWHAAEVLGSILGAEAVEIPQSLVDAFFGQQDEPEHWEPQADDDA